MDMHPDKVKLLADLAEMNAQAIKLSERAYELATGEPNIGNKYLMQPICDAIMALAGSVAVTDVSERYGKPRPAPKYLNQMANNGWSA